MQYESICSGKAWSNFSKSIEMTCNASSLPYKCTTKPDSFNTGIVPMSCTHTIVSLLCVPTLLTPSIQLGTTGDKCLAGGPDQQSCSTPVNAVETSAAQKATHTTRHVCTHCGHATTAQHATASEHHSLNPSSSEPSHTANHANLGSMYSHIACHLP